MKSRLEHVSIALFGGLIVWAAGIAVHSTLTARSRLTRQLDEVRR